MELKLSQKTPNVQGVNGDNLVKNWNKHEGREPGMQGRTK